jgi:hypothetical protein
VTVYTTASFEAMTVGQRESLPIYAPPAAIVELLLRRLPGLAPAVRTLALFRFDGSPFVRGSISEWIGEGPDLFALPLAEAFDWDAPIDRFYTIFEPEIRALLSPNATSSDKGLCQMALILHYLQSLGNEIAPFAAGFEVMTNFQPAVRALRLLGARRPLSKLAVAAFCAACYSLFSELIRGDTIELDRSDSHEDRTFEYAIKCISLVKEFAGGSDLRALLRDPRRGMIIDRIFTKVPDLEPQPFVSPFIHAQDVIVSVHPYIGLALVASTNKPLQLTSVIKIINPLNRDNPIDRRPCEVFAYDREIGLGGGFLAALFARLSVTQVIFFVVEDHAAISPLTLRLFSNALAIIGAGLRPLVCVAGLMLIGRDSLIAHAFPTDPAAISVFQPRKGPPDARQFDHFLAGAEFVRDESKRFPNAIRRMIFLGNGKLLRGSIYRGDLLRALSEYRIYFDAFTEVPNQELSGICEETRGMHWLVADAKSVSELAHFLDPNAPRIPEPNFS